MYMYMYTYIRARLATSFENPTDSYKQHQYLRAHVYSNTHILYWFILLDVTVFPGT